MVNIPHNVYIAASPDRVYEALSTGEGWASWFSGASLQTDGDGKGTIRLSWREKGSAGNELVGEVEDANPGKGFVFAWEPADTRTIVSFALEPYKDGTLIAFEETGFTTSEADIKALVRHAVGWGEALNLLKVYLEHGITYTQESIDFNRLD